MVTWNRYGEAISDGGSKVNIGSGSNYNWSKDTYDNSQKAADKGAGGSNMSWAPGGSTYKATGGLSDSPTSNLYAGPQSLLSEYNRFMNTPLAGTLSMVPATNYFNSQGLDSRLENGTLYGYDKATGNVLQTLSPGQYQDYGGIAMVNPNSLSLPKVQQPTMPQITAKDLQSLIPKFEYNVDAPKERKTSDGVVTPTLAAKNAYETQRAQRYNEYRNNYADAWKIYQDQLSNQMAQQQMNLNQQNLYAQSLGLAPSMSANDPTMQIRQAQQMYAQAQANGDVVGMQNAHNLAEQYRQQAGWGSGGVDGGSTAGLMTQAGTVTPMNELAMLEAKAKVAATQALEQQRLSKTGGGSGGGGGRGSGSGVTSYKLDKQTADGAQQFIADIAAGRYTPGDALKKLQDPGIRRAIELQGGNPDKIADEIWSTYAPRGH